jgi:hypothetical protein
MPTQARGGKAMDYSVPQEDATEMKPETGKMPENPKVSDAFRTAIKELPLPLRNLDDDCGTFSLAIDCDDELGVIEITSCYDWEKKEFYRPEARRLVEQFDTYAEYIPRCEGVRIIGHSYYHHGGPTEEGGHLLSNDFGMTDSVISVYRNSDRWVDISGMAIEDKTLRNIDQQIDKLLSRTVSMFYLRD